MKLTLEVDTTNLDELRSAQDVIATQLRLHGALEDLAPELGLTLESAPELGLTLEPLAPDAQL